MDMLALALIEAIGTDGDLVAMIAHGQEGRRGPCRHPHAVHTETRG